MDYVTGLSLVLAILFEDVLLCDVQSVMRCFEGIEFKAANVCLEVNKFEDCVAPLGDKCRDNPVFTTSVNQLKIFKPLCGGSSGTVCDVMGLQKCMAEVEYAEGADLRDNCAFYPRFEECTQPLIAQCNDNDTQYMNIKSSIDSFQHICARSDLASAQCDLQAAMNCLSGYQQTQPGGSTDMAAICSSLEKAMTCLAPIMESCKSDETFQKSLSTLTSVEPMCAGGDQCNVDFQKCYVDAGIDTTGDSNSQPTCDQVKTVQTCLIGLSTVCEGNYAYNQGKTSLQDVVTKCTGVDKCTGSLQKCYVEAGIDIDTTGDNTSDPTCEDAKTLQTCVMSLSTVCEGNYAYNQSKTGLQDVVAKCKGLQVFPSLVLILVAALLTFVTTF